MIHVDESDPVSDIEPSFPARDVVIKRGVDAKEIYELTTEIGRGKFGTVYKCQEKSTGLKLAAKFVPIPNRADRRNVEREVELMNSLQHSLIIQLYDALEYQKMMCVVLELVEGGELFDRVIDDDFVLTEKACVAFIRQVCQAMEFVHSNKIIHLDLKPENILCITREGNRIKIIDFGLARKYDPDKKLQVLFGTPEFVAPEVVNFDPISFGTDMWSVGVICYVLGLLQLKQSLSGLSPFMGSTDIETMANVTLGKYDFDDEAFTSVSKEALDFIAKLLVKDTSLRMTASDCVEHTWLKRQTKPQVAPRPIVIPATRYKTPPPIPAQVVVVADPVAAADDNTDEELRTTKDNLKSFIERWEEHPNSPYVFDTGSNQISLVTLGVDDNGDDVKRHRGASSGMSSRGCSPSPCGSINSELPATSEDLTVNNADNIVDSTALLLRQQSELFENETGHSNQFKEYLQSFERRHSDSNCVLNRSSSCEKINLADEIKKLSERLMMLSSINNELNDKLSNTDEEPITQIQLEPTIIEKTRPTVKTSTKAKLEDIELQKPIIASTFKPAVKEKPDFLKNRTKIQMNDHFNRSYNINESTSSTNSKTISKTTSRMSSFMRASSVLSTSSSSCFQTNSKTTSTTNATKKLNNDLSERLKSLDEMPALINRMEDERKVSQSIAINNKLNRFESVSISPPSHGGSAPWPVNRRAKFRMTQMSRDVPIGSPNSHQTVFLEEAVTTTKDCLLHLLDKYNESETRTAYSNTGRHQSMSLGMGLSDNLEYKSMNSLNFFFQRHATAGNTVKQMQAQLESKRKP